MSATPNDCGVYCDFETVPYQVDGAVARLTSCRHREVGGVQLPSVMFSPLAAFDGVRTRREGICTPPLTLGTMTYRFM